MELRHGLARVVHFHQPGGVSVVQVGGVVGGFVRQVDQLRLQRRTQPRQIFIHLGILARLKIAGMLHDSLAHFKRQIQSGKARIAMFEVFHDAQGVQVVLEIFAEAAHLAVEFLFAGMRERGMSNVVRQGERFREFLVQVQHGGGGAGDLGHLDGVG